MEHREYRCCVVRLTPPGRGGVASILLSGNGALEIFSRRWTGAAIVSHDRQYFGRFRLDLAGRCEEAIVYSPKSDHIEIHCHGGEAVVAAIESALVNEGATVISWKKYFCPGNSQQEIALKMLVAAPTERTAQILLDQYNGALERELSEMETLTEAEKQKRSEKLREHARWAKHLVSPFRVVLTGAVNAGKSSLLNAILGFDRAIVNSAPGTTRDAVSAQTAVDGFPVLFIDTAGFRETENELEQQGMQRAKWEINRADLVLRVIDATTEKKCGTLDKKNELLVLNKIDLVAKKEHDDSGCDDAERAARVSAVTGEGIEPLLERIARWLVPNPPQPFEAVPLVWPASTGDHSS